VFQNKLLVAPITATIIMTTPLAIAQQPIEPSDEQEPPLLERKITVLRGDIIAARVADFGLGQTFEMPERCGFKFVLPPDKKALHWHPLGKPVFKRDDIDTLKH